MMTSTVKSIGMSVLTFAMAFSGYAAVRHEPDLTGSQRCAFTPSVRKDAAIAIAVCLEKERLFKVADVFLDHLFDLVDIEIAEDIEKSRLVVGEFKRDPLGQLDANSRTFLQDHGLDDVNMRWGVLSMDDFSFMRGELKAMKGISLAIAGKFDLEKVIKGIQEKPLRPLYDCVDFEVMTIAGEKAWRVQPRDAEVAKTFKEKDMNPCMASLDGQLVLVAQSPEVLARQIRLYRHGEGKADVLGDFPVGTDLMRVYVSGVGRYVQECAGDKLQQLNKFIPNGEKIVVGIKTLVVDVRASPDGILQQSAALDAASEQDADVLRAHAKTGLMALRAKVSEMKSQTTVEDRPWIQQMMKILEGLKIGGRNGRVEVSSDGELIVACAASYSYVSVAMGKIIDSIFMNSQERDALQKMCSGGVSLVQGLIRTHATRRSDLASAWPRAKVGNGAPPSGDAASRAYGSATDCFNDLFDMSHYGTSEWAPMVDGKILGALGTNAVVDKAIRAEGLDWCIVANVTDDTPDFMPVLISANFNPALLPCKWDGRTDRFTRLPIGPASGAAKSMFGDKFIVIVRKDGCVRKVKAEKLTYFLLFCRSAFDLSGKESPFVYLTPTGVVTPGAFMKEERKK